MADDDDGDYVDAGGGEDDGVGLGLGLGGGGDESGGGGAGERPGGGGAAVSPVSSSSAAGVSAAGVSAAGVSAAATTTTGGGKGGGDKKGKAKSSKAKGDESVKRGNVVGASVKLADAGPRDVDDAAEASADGDSAGAGGDGDGAHARRSSRLAAVAATAAAAAADAKGDGDDFEYTEDVEVFRRRLEAKSVKFAAADSRMHDVRGSEFDLAWVRAHGLGQPVLIRDRTGLGMAVPGPGFTVRDVADTIGHGYPIDVIDVASQMEERWNWTLGRWARYFHRPASRKSVLNVISLEFSGTPLEAQVRSPRLVRQLDWIDVVWPGRRHVAGQYPRVQYYCLMSVGGSWTDFHIDFGGTSVWYHVHTGRKVFLFIPPTDANLRAYEAWTTSPAQATTWLPDLVDTCFQVALQAGNTLIIPAGWIHAVFTPVDALVFGGNFMHGYDMPTQLRIFELEAFTKVPRKYRFPYYEHLQWYAAAYYLQFCRLPAFPAVVAAGAAASAADLAAVGASWAEVAGLPALVKTLALLQMTREQLAAGAPGVAPALVVDAAAPALVADAAAPAARTGVKLKLKRSTAPAVTDATAPAAAASAASGGAVGGAGGGAGDDVSLPATAPARTPSPASSAAAAEAAAPAAAGASATDAAVVTTAAPPPPPPPPPPAVAAKQRVKGTIAVGEAVDKYAVKLVATYAAAVAGDDADVFPAGVAAEEAANMANAASPAALLAELAARIAATTPAACAAVAGAYPVPSPPSALRQHHPTRCKLAVVSALAVNDFANTGKTAVKHLPPASFVGGFGLYDGAVPPFDGEGDDTTAPGAGYTYNEVGPNATTAGAAARDTVSGAALDEILGSDSEDSAPSASDDEAYKDDGAADAGSSDDSEALGDDDDADSDFSNVSSDSDDLVVGRRGDQGDEWTSEESGDDGGGGGEEGAGEKRRRARRRGEGGDGERGRRRDVPAVTGPLPSGIIADEDPKAAKAKKRRRVGHTEDDEFAALAAASGAAAGGDATAPAAAVRSGGPSGTRVLGSSSQVRRLPPTAAAGTGKPARGGGDGPGAGWGLGLGLAPGGATSAAADGGNSDDEYASLGGVDDLLASGPSTMTAAAPSAARTVAAPTAAAGGSRSGGDGRRHGAPTIERLEVAPQLLPLAPPPATTTGGGGGGDDGDAFVDADGTDGDVASPPAALHRGAGGAPSRGGGVAGVRGGSGSSGRPGVESVESLTAMYTKAPPTVRLGGPGGGGGGTGGGGGAPDLAGAALLQRRMKEARARARMASGLRR